MTTLTPSDFATIEKMIDEKLNARLSGDVWLTTSEAMKILNIKSKATFYGYVDKLQLSKKKIGRSVRYSQNELNKKLNQIQP